MVTGADLPRTESAIWPVEGVKGGLEVTAGEAKLQISRLPHPSGFPFLW